MTHQSPLFHKLLFLLAPTLLGGFLFLIPSAHASTINVTSSITTNTAWLGSNVYVIQNSITVNSGVTLTIASGTVVKFVTSTYPYLLVNGTLSVNGTASKTVTFTSLNDNSVGGTISGSNGHPLGGDWDEIAFAPGASSTMSYTNIRYGGNTSYGGHGDNIYESGGTLNISYSQIASSSADGLTTIGGSMSVVSSTIANNSHYGVNEFYSTGTLALTSSTFTNNGYGLAYIDVGSGINFTPSGNLASSTGVDSGFYITGTTVTSTTWYKDLPYIPYSLTVATGTTLTINHGTIVKFYSGSYIDNQGIVNAQGTPVDKIYFTSINNNSIGGITSGSSTSTPSPGDWNDIEIDAGASTTINNAVVEYGGSSNSLQAEIAMGGGTLNLLNSKISSSSYSGFGTTGGTIQISTSTFVTNHQYGINESNSPGTLTLTGNTFANNGNGYGDLSLDLSGGLNFIPSGNIDLATTTNVGYRGIVLSGTLATSTTLSFAGEGLPYIIDGSLTVASGTTLVITPGFIKFGVGALLEIASHGTLNIKGNASDNPSSTAEIFFTSLTDDSVGGDTNADGTSTVPQPGDSGDIQIDSGASSTITGANILYGGNSYNNYASLYQAGGTLILTSTTIASSSNYGFRIDGGTNTTTASQFLTNGYGVYVNGGTVVANASSVFQGNLSGFYNESGVTSTATATNDYWGSISGPYNFDSNPSGTGDSISNYVTYNPFINNNQKRPHYLEGISSVHNTSTIRWSGTTTYSAAWAAATSTWNALGVISIVPATSTADLTIADVNWGDVGAVAQYFQPPSNIIDFNTYWMGSAPLAFQKNTAMHELGHALGLDHSYLGNIMFYMGTSQTTLGSQDISDYDYLW